MGEGDAVGVPDTVLIGVQNGIKTVYKTASFAYTIGMEVSDMSAMRFMSMRELQKSGGEIREALANDGRVVITTAGKPTALMIPIGETDFEETLTLVNQMKFAKAVRDIRQEAAQKGLDNMTIDEINAVIAQYRKERREKEMQGAEQ
jgi:antitoxin (DNA-binding transcriptional repressor) of toxin-antitoxin stability system